jgi:predicted GIY-YIG superfamily endonuclease
MVTIYVLKLERGKYYVGLTKNDFQRLDQHRDGYGAAWTKKYEPLSIVSVQSGLRASAENRITLETMKKYGVRNVRGGDWCKVRMTKREITDLEKKVRSLKKTPAKKKAKRKATRGYCIRCRDRKKFEVGRPLCLDCYDVWVQYSNPDYIEDHCHKCGREWDTSIERPLCTSCWRKSRR